MLGRNCWSNSWVKFTGQITGQICRSNLPIKFLDQIPRSNCCSCNARRYTRNAKRYTERTQANASNPRPAAGQPRSTHGHAYGQAENGQGRAGKRQGKGRALWARPIVAWLGLSLVHTGRRRNSLGNLTPVRINPNGWTGRETVASEFARRAVDSAVCRIRKALNRTGGLNRRCMKRPKTKRRRQTKGAFRFSARHKKARVLRRMAIRAPIVKISCPTRASLCDCLNDRHRQQARVSVRAKTNFPISEYGSVFKRMKGSVRTPMVSFPH